MVSSTGTFVKRDVTSCDTKISSASTFSSQTFSTNFSGSMMVNLLIDRGFNLSSSHFPTRNCKFLSQIVLVALIVEVYGSLVTHKGEQGLWDEIIETPLLTVDAESCSCSNFPNTDTFTSLYFYFYFYFYYLL